MAPTYSNGQEMVSIYLIKIKITTKFFNSILFCNAVHLDDLAFEQVWWEDIFTAIKRSESKRGKLTKTLNIQRILILDFPKFYIQQYICAEKTVNY